MRALRAAGMIPAMTDTQTPAPGAPVWQDPPTSGRSRYDWATLLAPFVDNPGKWGMVMVMDGPSKAETAASNLRKGRIPACPPGRWQFRSVRHEEDDDPAKGTSDLYAKWIGPEVEAVDPRNPSGDPRYRGTVQASVVPAEVQVMDPPEAEVVPAEVVDDPPVAVPVQAAPVTFDLPADTPETQIDPPEADEPPVPMTFTPPADVPVVADPFTLHEQAAVQVVADEDIPF